MVEQEYIIYFNCIKCLKTKQIEGNDLKNV
jgi:hypothetical protein